MLNFREAKNKDDFLPIIEWSNSSDAYLFTPSFLLEKKKSLDETWENYKKLDKIVYLIEFEGKIIGEVSLDLKFPLVLKKNEKTAWVGIVFGKSLSRGKGFGKKAMEFIEKKARESGAQRIELGCFEFNTRAYEFYKKLGYTEIGRLDNFTLYNNKWWKDIRMEKRFE